MSEKSPGSVEKPSFKNKHLEWITSEKGIKTEAASGFMGIVGGLLGMSVIAALVTLNPIALALGGALAGIGGYRFTKNEIKHG